MKQRRRNPRITPPKPPSSADAGTQLRWQRQTLRMTLAELGSRTGLAIGYLSMVERGQRTPSRGAEAAIREALGLAEPLPFDRPREERPTPDDLVARLGAGLSAVIEVDLVVLARAVQASIGDVRRGLLELAERLELVGMTVLDDGATARLAPAPHLKAVTGALVQRRRRHRWSMAQMETLSIAIAHGATTKREIEDVRGVDSGEVMAGLVERGYLTVHEDEAAPGRPNVYRPTLLVLEVFGTGATSIEELRAQIMPSPPAETEPAEEAQS